MKRRRFLCILAASAVASALPAQTQPGKLVIAGGAITTARPALWRVMLAERLPGRPIGIISTASEKPAATGEPLAAALNEEHGNGTAVFVPLDAKLANAADPAIVALIETCGGFYFTGGSQTLTTKTLRNADGSPTPAWTAIRAINAAGGVIGGSSAGAAIMSDPMITGGVSREAMKNGATPASQSGAAKGVGFGPGLGFSPGILYCQHHVERGRFGRLLVALTSAEVGLKTGFGISEDTALVVDHSAGEARVIGARDVLYLQAANARRAADGGITGVTLAYLTPGDLVHLDTGEVRPAPDKQPVITSTETAILNLPDAWARAALRGLFQNLSQAGAAARASARDADFEIVFQRQPESAAWFAPAAAEAQPESWTLTGVAVEVRPFPSEGAE